MPKRKKFVTVEQFSEKERAKKSETEAKNKKLPGINENWNYCSVAKIGISEETHCPNVDVAISNGTVKNIQEILPNPGLIKEMLKSIRHENWDEKIGNQLYVLESLEPTSSEYVLLKDISRKIDITDVKRICNPYLYLQYRLKLLQSRQCEEKQLFHGTSKKNIDGICSRNFDWRLHGDSNGNKFGQGVSFTPFTGYAMKYGDISLEKVMLMAEVIVGDCCWGNESTVVPPDRYDTTKNTKESVYVKYDDNTFYPTYLIHYVEI